ncbi:MAG: bifunctional DNA primase/polymerase [Candidatus Acidiferrales bacterium]|jgi:hypothetical protein
MSSATFADRAALTTQYGIPVMPLGPHDKIAFLPEWQNLATTDAAKITEWDKQNPAYNCGAVAHEHEFWFLDIDNPAVFSQIEKETGHRLDEIDTLVVCSSGEKRHYYFKQDSRSEALGNFSSDDADGERFSVRAHNQYVVSAGSMHPKTGQPYEVVNEPLFGTIPAAPDWLMDWLIPYTKKNATASAAQTAQVSEAIIISDGKRNKTLASMAGTMRSRGMDKEAILAALRVINQKQCQPPLDDADVITIATSISRYPAGALPSTPTDAEAETPRAVIVRPELSETAFYGLAGRIIKKLQPQTESHPAGNLGELLLSFGNMVGRCAFFLVESTRHYTNENMVKVGESAKARKGTGKNRIRAIFDLVDPEWRKNCDISGVGSGEAIINLIRDERQEDILNRRSGQFQMTLVDKGIEDKRACVNIGEFQGILAVCHKPEGLLSVVLRDGWDGVPLRNTVKASPARCERPHLTILGDTTQADLSTSLTQADRTNGFANRILWVYVYRTQLLAHGGEEIDWTAEAEQLIQAAEFARCQKRMFMSKPAYDYWERTLYPKLERDVPGFIGALTSRASAHVIRLAMIHALMNQSEHIEVEHLKAAAAFWQYCEDSVQTIFGDLLSPEQSQILDFLSAVGTATKTRIIRDCFQGHRKSDLIQRDIDVLAARGKITAKAIDGVWNYSIARSS